MFLFLSFLSSTFYTALQLHEIGVYIELVCNSLAQNTQNTQAKRQTKLTAISKANIPQRGHHPKRTRVTQQRKIARSVCRS